MAAAQGQGHTRLARLYGALLWAIIGFVQVAECQHLVITPHGRQVKTLKSNLVLTCTIVEYLPTSGKPEMTWRDPMGKEISDTAGRMFVRREDSLEFRLYILGIMDGDAGVYTCETTADGALLQERTSLILFETISFEDLPTAVSAPLGSDVLLPCRARGQPAPIMSWRVSKNKIPSDGKKFSYVDNGLRISDIDLRDAADYECRAEVMSQGHLKVRLISLDIEYPPVISRGLNETTYAVLGSDVTLRCDGHGNPAVKYEWFQEQEESQMAAIKVRLAEGVDTWVLSKVTQADEGRYRCKLSNSLGSQQSQTEIKVLVPPEVKDLQPKVVLETNTLMMSCSATGVPEPEILWQKVGSDAAFVEGKQPGDRKITIDNSRPGMSKLNIHDIQRSHAGEYSCTARNSVGQDVKTGLVNVEFRPTVNTTEYEQFGWESQVRNFTCTGFGNPLPTLNWYREGQHLVDTEVYKVFTDKSKVIVSTLQITVNDDRAQPWIYGSYSCIAKNRYSMSTKVVYLREAKTPEPPRNVSVAEETPTTVTLTAALPASDGGLPVTSWRVWYEPARSLNEDGHEKTLLYGAADPIVVTDLDPGTPYTLHIAAGNAVGYGNEVKFKVNTPRKLPAEQADVPSGNHPGLHRTSSDRETQLKMGLAKVTSNDENTGESNMVGLVVGVAAVLSIIVIIIVGGAVYIRRKRKHNDYAPAWKNLFARKPPSLHNDGSVVCVSESKDIDQVQLEIRRDPSQPDVVLQSAMMGGKPMTAEKCRSPMMELRRSKDNLNCPRTPPTGKASKSGGGGGGGGGGGHYQRPQGIPLGGAASGSPRLDARRPPAGAAMSALGANNPYSIQNVAWESMLQHQAMEIDEPEAEMERRAAAAAAAAAAASAAAAAAAESADELTPMMDLPPPPPFLLDNQPDVGELDADRVSYQDILDGYHSEENIDDAEENDNFHVQLPGYQPHHNHHATS